MKKWNMIIDVALCENCNCCFLSCKDEYVGNSYQGYSEEQPLHGQRWINIMTKERGSGSLFDVAYLPIPCMHCDNAPCIQSVQDGSVYKRKDGIVIIDPVKAKGNKELLKACPYGAIWWNDSLSIPQKCTLCAHLLDEGHKEPRCVQACPTGALKILHESEPVMQKYISENKLEVFHPEFGTRPRVLYKNLYRYLNCFIAGSVAYMNGKVKDCAESATVKLYKEKSEIGEITTDIFGDFKFDKIIKDSGKYTIEIQFQNFNKTIPVEVGESIYLEEILL